MRILFTTHGAYGHFHPIAPLASAAQARGHDVVIATAPQLVEWVAACGFRVVPAGVRTDDIERGVQALRIADPLLGAFHRFSTVAVPPVLADLLRLAEGWRPDVVVHEEGEYAAPLFSAVSGVPCITQSWPAPARPEQERQLYRDLLQPIWAANGLSCEARTSGAVYLDACPPPYQSGAIASIPGVVTVRPVAFDGPTSTVPPWLANLPRPAAYVTLGTVPIFSRPEVLRAAVEAVEALVAAVVVTTGPNPPDVVAGMSPHVHGAAYLAQSDVLPRVDLVVSHGGAGTTLGAITHGLPHLVLPGFAPSQQRNASRTQQLGFGLCVDQDEPATQLQEAAQRLLTDGAYRTAAATAAASLDRLPSPQDCVTLLEDAAAGA